MKTKGITRMGCMLVALVLLLGLSTPALAAQLDYTMAYKLFRQLGSGSGFSGTLEVALSANEAVEGEALVTDKPFLIDWNYIYVRPTGHSLSEHRLDAALMNDDAPVTQATFQLRDGVLAAQSPLLGEGWFEVSTDQLLKAGEGGEEQTLGAQLLPGIRTAIENTGMPALVGFALPQLLRVHGFTDEAQRERLQSVMEKMSLRMDLWIEDYRQNAELGRLEDGSAIITVTYSIPPANIKTQAMQMVLDILSDEAARQSLADYVGEETAALLLNPDFQPYYFAAIEALPITSEATLSRTVDMKGDTVALHLSLPFYDAEGGEVTLRYTRERGEGDLPDTNTISMESASRTVELSFLTYRSMTDVTVYQGIFTVSDGAADAFAVRSEEEQPLLPDVAFTLSRQTTETREDDDLNVYTDNWNMKLEPNPNGKDPEAFLPMEIQLDSCFASKTPQTSATNVTISLTFSGEERPQKVHLKLDGQTRRQWEVEELPAERTDLLTLDGEGLEALLANLLTEGSDALSFFMQNTQETVDETVPSEESTAETAVQE